MNVDPEALVIRGRRSRALVGLALVGSFVGVIVAEGLREPKNAALLVFLVLTAPALLSYLRLSIRPPRLMLAGGHLEVRVRAPPLRIAVAALDDVFLEGPRLVVRLHRRPRPATDPPAGDASAPRLRLEGGFFSQRQVDSLRAALGMAAQHDSPPASSVDGFQRRLHALTPRVVVTPALIAANAIAFVVLWALGVDPLSPDVVALIDAGAGYGPRTANGEPWRLLTAAFLHVGVVHLLFNLWALSWIGGLVERLFGSVGFLVAYLLAAIGGSVASTQFHPHVVSAGASGAVFGLFGALLAFLVVQRHAIPGDTLRDGRRTVLAFVGYNVAFGVLMPHIDMAAHLGGLAIGFVFGCLLALRGAWDRRAGRVSRALAVAVLGGLATWGAVATLPAGIPDWIARVREFESSQPQVLDKILALESQHAKREIDEEELAARIEESVLAPWRRMRASFDEEGDLPDSMRTALERLRRYLALREESWELLVEALRERDFSKRARSWAKRMEADRLAAEAVP